MKIGLIPMSAKPYHAGHDGLVRIAAKECDRVELFVSLSDRKRPGELPILGSAMKKIWQDYLAPTLPDNVDITYGGTPLTNMFKVLTDADKNESNDTFAIYSDRKDILKYTDEKMSMYTPFLFEHDQIVRRGVDRNETMPVSGTKMRQYLAAGDLQSFSQCLPPAVRQHSRKIMNMLLADVNESAVRKYVMEIVNVYGPYLKKPRI